MNFIEASKYFQQDGIFIRTALDVRTDTYKYLRDYDVLLIDGPNIVSINYVIKDYTRTNVFIIEKGMSDFSGMVLDGTKKCKISGQLIAKLQKNAVEVFTVNQQRLSLAKPQLTLEGKRESTNPLMDQFVQLVNSINDPDTRTELQTINIDMPEYGIMNDRLFIVNKDDPFINRMMIFEKMQIRNKNCNVLSLYIFGQDLQTMQSHILNKYIMIVNGVIKINVDIDENFKVLPNDDTVLEIPLGKSKYRDHNIKEAVKLFNRKYEYGKF